MLKWLAPLLLFTYKPEVLVRVFIAVIAAAILAFGVWVLSNVALTIDSLKNPYIAVTYGAVLLCFFIIVGMVAWLRLRRSGSPPKTIVATAERPLPLPTEVVAKRARDLSAKWETESRRTSLRPVERIGATPAASAPAGPKITTATATVRLTLTVTGPAYTGKTALIARLVAATRAESSATHEIVRLVDAGPIDGDDRHVATLVAAAAATDGVLFVVDQDLRAPEVAAIARFIGTRKPLYLVLNKTDQFNAADRDAILLSMRAKMPPGFAPANAVSVAGEPSPVEREIVDARGAVRVETRRPSSDVAALTNLLGRVLRPAAGHVLQFETGS